MTKEELIYQIKLKRSFLCVGLDPDINKIPSHLLDFDDPIFHFNKQIIDQTKDLCVAYKPNIAFYESMGASGMKTLQKTLDYIPDNIFTIADAKRGDIGNTSTMYARSFFEKMHFDAITLSPYMGSDSVIPFLKFKNKWIILLALTSNEGALDFQKIEGKSGKQLFQSVLEISSGWGSASNMMYVVGATRSSELIKIRKIIPNHFLLIPGVGAQGGSLEEVAEYGMNDDCSLLVNLSRAIIYAGSGNDFAQSARKKAKKIQEKMDELLVLKGI